MNDLKNQRKQLEEKLMEIRKFYSLIQTKEVLTSHQSQSLFEFHFLLCDIVSVMQY